MQPVRFLADPDWVWMKGRLFLALIILLAVSSGCGDRQAAQEGSAAPGALNVAQRDAFAFEQNRRLGRGLNLGNALEAPGEGEWGVVLEEDFFKIIKAGGFDSVRVPIRWSAHAEAGAPYTIDPAFFDRIDWVVENALENDVAVILNIHHYEELIISPRQHNERFLALWRQIAAHYQAAPDQVFFEPLNEPNGVIAAGQTWNNLAAEVIQEIRKTNPDRTLILGPGDWNAISGLRKLRLPEDDRNLIVTVHYYQPFNFTHQGAEWADDMDRHLGTTWSATQSQRFMVETDLDQAARWGAENGRPIFLGEFGAYNKADLDSRTLWTSYVARQAEARGISWAYWEFCAGFGAYDRAAGDWVAALHEALIP